jgi:hypothetical protein
MLAFGFSALLVPEKILSLFGKTTGSRAPSDECISPSQVILAVRSGGAIGILMGLFVLLVTWRNL